MQYSVVDYLELEKGSMRLNAEFYEPQYLQLENILNKSKAIELGKITKRIDVGYVGSMVSEYNGDGVLLLQTQNVREFFIETSVCKRINPYFHQKLKKSHIT